MFLVSSHRLTSLQICHTAIEFVIHSDSAVPNTSKYHHQVFGWAWSSSLSVFLLLLWAVALSAMRHLQVEIEPRVSVAKYIHGNVHCFSRAGEFIEVIESRNSQISLLRKQRNCWLALFSFEVNNWSKYVHLSFNKDFQKVFLFPLVPFYRWVWGCFYGVVVYRKLMSRINKLRIRVVPYSSCAVFHQGIEVGIPNRCSL